jgi:hypothetical protein
VSRGRKTALGQFRRFGEVLDRWLSSDRVTGQKTWPDMACRPKVGVAVPSGPKLLLRLSVAERAVTTNKALADAYAANVLPVIREIQRPAKARGVVLDSPKLAEARLGNAPPRNACQRTRAGLDREGRSPSPKR